MIATNADAVDYVTAMVGGQLFGLPISRVQDVFVPVQMAPVPLAAPEIAGLINLRGRVVTMIDMRRRLDLTTGDRRTPMAVGVEYRGESYGLLIDEVGEVLRLPATGREHNPVNLDARLASVSAGVHRLEERLLVVLDVDRVLDIATSVQAA
jgi:purine-binding chemotaxis protein CheW